VFTMTEHRADPWAGEENFSAYLNWMGTITATDRYTVTIPVREGYKVYADWAYFFFWGWYGTIVPPELVGEDSADWRNYVGAGVGAWRLTDYVDGGFAAYERNPDYWDTTIIDGIEYSLPFADELMYPIMPDLAVQLAAVRTGAVDIWMKVPWVYEETLAASNPELVKWEVPSWSYFNVKLQLSVPPYDDIRVRKALNMAIDRFALIEGVYGGHGTPYSWLYPKSLPSIHVPIEERPEEIQEIYEYNPEGARQLIAEYLADEGYPEDFKIETSMAVRTHPGEADIASFLKDAWAEIGIEVELMVAETPAWTNYIRLEPPGNQMIGWTASNPTELSGLALYWSPYELWGAFTKWNDPVFDEGYVTLNITADADEQNILFKLLADRVIEEAVSVFVPTPNQLRYAQPWVKNYFGEAMSNYVTSIDLLNLTWLDQDLKAEMGY